MHKALIVEDEKAVAHNLNSLLDRVAPDIQVVANTQSVQETVAWLRTHAADLVFLDIQLSDGLSFQIFEQISVQVPVIFTTAYDQYALKAFELHSIDYLLKPIQEAALKRSIDKWRAMQPQLSLDAATLQQLMQSYATPHYKKRFMVFAGQKIRTVTTEEVAYFQSLQKNTYLTTHQGRTYPIDFTLDKLEQQLPPDQFFRINRQCMVHISAIQEMHLLSKSRIKVDLQPPTKEKTQVSLAKTPAFRKWLEQ